MNKAPTPSTASGASFGQAHLPLEPNSSANGGPAPQVEFQPLGVFFGPSNNRQARVLDELMKGRRLTQNDVRSIGGALNGPHIISELRQQGLSASLDLPTEWVKCIDRDGKSVRYGVYFLTDQGKAKVRAWMQRQAESAGEVAA